VAQTLSGQITFHTPCNFALWILLPSIQPLLRRERQKRKLLRLNLTRAVAGLAAAAVAAVTLVVFSPSASADPSEAYSLYQEANIGW
jgi:hypothetical protein